MADEMVERVAKAMYNSHEFVKGWDHPKLNKAWRPLYRKLARIAIKIISHAR